MPTAPVAGIRWRCTSVALLLAAGGATAADAQSFRLRMTGTLDGRSSIVSGGGATPLAGPSAFTLDAYFSTSSPNLVESLTVPFPPFTVPGFVAYRPTSALMTLGGRTYALQGYDAANPLGVAVAIFDNTTPFGPPNRYGVGLIQDPLLDGSGFIADYGTASPAFTIASTGVVPTTFQQFFGVGVTSGVCTSGPPNNCQQYAVTPIPMTWAGQSFALSLGSYEEDLAPGGVAWTAQISAVPEPASVALVGAGVAVLAAAGARRRRAAGHV